jgi:hypothetical protein
MARLFLCGGASAVMVGDGNARFCIGASTDADILWTQRISRGELWNAFDPMGMVGGVP